MSKKQKKINKKYNKTKKIAIGLISIVIVLLLGGIGYIGYEKYSKNHETQAIKPFDPSLDQLEWMTSTNYVGQRSGVYDIYKSVELNGVNQKIYENAIKTDRELNDSINKQYDRLKQEFKTPANKELFNKTYYTRYKISDHAPIFTDFSYPMIDKNKNGETQYHHYRIAHWNVLNHSFTSEDKNKSLANIIWSQAYDIVGMTEINAGALKSNDNKINEFLKYLNGIIPSQFKDKFEYDAIVSKDTPIKNKYVQDKDNNKHFIDSGVPSKGASEQVVILYNIKKFINIDITKENTNLKNDALKGVGYFRNVKKGSIEDVNGNTYTNAQYIREPFGATFSLKNTIDDLQLSFIFAHLDSPGTSNNGGELGTPKEFVTEINGQGGQELYEAQNLDKIMNLSNDPNEKVIFLGDTNIKKGNEDKAFLFKKDNKYKFFLSEDKAHYTSLSMPETRIVNQKEPYSGYANPYDKIIGKNFIFKK